MNEKRGLITRRELLKRGLATSALYGLTRRLAFADGGGGVGKTPFTTQPFLERLPIAPVKTTPFTGSTCLAQLDAHRPAGFTQAGPFDWSGNPYHQFIDRPECKPAAAYEIHVKEAYQSCHPAIPPTKFWGYDGMCPGPTFKETYGHPVMVRFYNELPKDHVGFGIPSLATHLHNSHTAAESDGYPGNYQDSQTWWDHHYLNMLNGFSTDPPTTNVGDAMGTLWYHDHRNDFTAQNVYAGLAGFYLLFDELDCDDETNVHGLQLPSGEYDVPLAFGDKVFDANGQLVYDFFNLDGILGDKYTVNGKVQPYFEVEPRKYRFRLLDAGPSRFYAFALSDGTPLVQIANDGNLLARPVSRRVVTCGVAERHDVIIDFSKYAFGDKVYLMNRAEQTDGRGPTSKLLTPGDPLIEFRVKKPLKAPDRSQIKDVLRLPPPMDLSKVVQTRTWEFNRSGGGWTVNGKIFRESEARASVKCNTREVWIFKNGGGGWAHPIHPHMEEFRTLSRNGGTPPAYEDRKDVAVLLGGEEVRVYLHFRDFLGKYVMHCHNVIHEDHSMMIRFDIVP
jgi:FtsP/CotA-like multicopper oxidase with cupredoxin domain